MKEKEERKLLLLDIVKLKKDILLSKIKSSSSGEIKLKIDNKEKRKAVARIFTKLKTK